MFELEPSHALAISMHHGPGVYALLLGSGLSRSAGIPTGWEITLDLIRRVAALEGVTESDDWATWFQGRFSEAPNYSRILDTLAATPSERRSILHGYIEPQEGEDIRRPTKAHRAIAKLVASGSVRVIVTTNFDRLIENALREEGVEPIVIASEDALAGATPMVHARCVVVKLHGDYLDTRIRNTDSELATYTSAMDGLLDEIFDQFGLLISGWSGEWDTALRDALMRAPNRRYSLYWATRSAISTAAQDIISHRAGASIPIADADSFFAKLADVIEMLRASDKMHPQSVAMAVTLAKRYCRDDLYNMEWAEFLSGEVSRLRGFINGQEYPTERPANPIVNSLIRSFISRSEVLRRACMICGRWGTAEAKTTMARCLRALASYGNSRSSYSLWDDLRSFPAALAFYWAVAGALACDDFETIKLLAHTKSKRSNQDDELIVALPFMALLQGDWKFLEGLERHHTPMSDFAFNLFQSEIVDCTVDKDDADELFDRLELLLALEFAHFRLPHVAKGTLWFWAPFGRFVWRSGRPSLSEKLSTYENLPLESPIYRSGLLGGSPQTAAASIRAFRDFLKEIRLR